jgi:hypothetical protein
VQVRELLVKKKASLVSTLKSLAARVPRQMMQGVSAKFAEIEKILKVKTVAIEDVDQQRKYIESLPNKIMELVGEVDAIKVRHAHEAPVTRNLPFSAFVNPNDTILSQVVLPWYQLHPLLFPYHSCFHKSHAILVSIPILFPMQCTTWRNLTLLFPVGCAVSSPGVPCWAPLLSAAALSLQPWYEALDSFQYLLPEDEAKDKFTGDTWAVKVMHLGERILDSLSGDAQRYQQEMLDEQAAFADVVAELHNVRPLLR